MSLDFDLDNLPRLDGFSQQVFAFQVHIQLMGRAS
jgi:hypothetical protein